MTFLKRLISSLKYSSLKYSSLRRIQNSIEQSNYEQVKLFNHFRSVLGSSIDILHSSGAIPDINKISDIDISTYNYHNIEDILSKFKYIKINNTSNNKIIYEISGFPRSINLCVCINPKDVIIANRHRKNGLWINKNCPIILLKATLFKRDGFGTEESYAKAMSLKGNHYKIMADVNVRKIAKKVESKFYIANRKI